MRNKCFYSLILIICLFQTSCDSHIPIYIPNNTIDTAFILVKTNPDFRTEKLNDYTTKDDFDVYKLAPNEQMEVGSAIAEIDNDIPFETIRIITSIDTISASSLEEIKKLFDKKTFGGLKVPYNISIK